MLRAGFNELFHAETLVFLLAGIIFALIISLKVPKVKILNSILISAIIGVVCEVLMNMLKSYAVTIILLFTETFFAGVLIGLFIGGIIRKHNSKQ